MDKPIEQKNKMKASLIDVFYFNNRNKLVKIDCESENNGYEIFKRKCRRLNRNTTLYATYLIPQTYRVIIKNVAYYNHKKNELTRIVEENISIL